MKKKVRIISTPHKTGGIAYTKGANRPADKVQYQKGGKTPIYTSDKRKVQAYQDSLTLAKAFDGDINKAKSFTNEEWYNYADKVNKSKKYKEAVDAYTRLQEYTHSPNGIIPRENYIRPFSEGDGAAEYKYPVQPYTSYKQDNLQQLPISQPNQLPTGTGYTPRAIDNPYITESIDWYSPEVQGGQYTPAGFRTTSKMKEFKGGGPIGYTNMSTRAQPTTTQMPQNTPQYSTGEQWYIDHPQQYMSQGQQQGTPQQQRDHDYLRNKMYQQEAEERANREFANSPRWQGANNLANRFMDASDVVGGAGIVKAGIKGISKKVAKKMADDIMPYSGNFPAAYTKGVKGNTPMPTITEVPPLSAEDKVYQSFGVKPRTKKVQTDEEQKKLMQDWEDYTLDEFHGNPPTQQEIEQSYMDARNRAHEEHVKWHKNDEKKYNVPMFNTLGPSNRAGVFDKGYNAGRVEDIGAEYYPLSTYGKPHRYEDKLWYKSDAEDYAKGDEWIMRKDETEGINRVLKNSHTHYTDYGPVTPYQRQYEGKGMPKSLMPNEIQQNKYGGSIQYQQGGKVRGGVPERYNPVPSESKHDYLQRQYSSLLTRYPGWTKEDEQGIDDRNDMIFKGVRPTMGMKTPIDPRTMSSELPYMYSDYSYLNKPQFTNMGMEPGTEPMNMQEYQQGGSVTNNNTMKKRYRITEVPEMAGGGEPFKYYGQGVNPEQQKQWNNYIGALNSAPGRYVRNWDHNQVFQQDMAKRMGITNIAGIQGDIANRAQTNPNTVSYTNGLSGADSWVGTKTIGETYRNNPGVSPLPIGGNTPFPTTNSYNPSEVSIPGIPQPQRDRSKWYTDEGTDYSLNSMRSHVPSMRRRNDQYGCANDLNNYAYGGNIPGTYNQLDTAWNYGKSLSAMYDKDPYQLKDVIPAADENSDPENLIVIEKDEVVLQPNNGRIQAQKASTGSHASGNDKTVEVKDGSFIISDTNELKIKDKGLHRTYGLKPKASGYTPAKLVTKDVNRLNEANKILANPASDKDSRRTAQLTVDTLMKERIQPVVAMQEQMKQAMGIPTPGQQYAGGGPYADRSSVVFLPEEDVASLPEYTISAKRPGVADLPNRQVLLPTPTANYLPQTVPVSQPTNFQAGKQESGVGDSMGSMEGTGAPPNNPRFTRPDQLNMTNSMLNYATLQKFLPYEPPVNGVIPETVYMDDTRARAAVSEQANSAYRQAAMNRGSGKLANFLAIQGQAGKQAADVAGQYANMNTQIANTANQQAAGITNQILEGQRNRLKSLHQGNTIAAQEYANEERKARGEIVNSYNQAWKNRAGYQNINEMAEHFAYDPSTGYVKFHSDGDRVEYIKKLANTSTGSKFKSPKEVYDYLVSQNIKEDDASKSAADWAEINTFNMKDRTQSTSKVGNTKKVATTVSRKFGGLHKFFR